jgi:hypothetical protein
MCFVLSITALFEYLCKETQTLGARGERKKKENYSKNNRAKTENRTSRRRINKKKNDLGATGLHSN